MKNVMLIYKPKHASHRLINATISQYDCNYNDCKSHITIYPYCIGKENQLRFDRFVERNKIDVIYIHEEEKEFLEKVKETGVEFYTYTRADFCDRKSYGWSYEVTYNYTLINELVNNEKLKSGKITKYKMSMGKLIKTDVFSVDEHKYKHYSDSEKEALNVYIIELEKMNRNAEKELQDYIKYKNKSIEETRVKINKYKKDYENM